MQYCETTNRKAIFQVQPKGLFARRRLGSRCSAAAVAGAVGDARCAPPSHCCSACCEASPDWHSGLSGGYPSLRLPRRLSGKESFCWHTSRRRRGFDRWTGDIPRRRTGQPAPVFLPGEPRGQRSPWASGHGVTQSWTWARLSAGAQADRKPEFHLNLEFVLLRTALPQAFCGKSISAQLKKEVWKEISNEMR